MSQTHREELFLLCERMQHLAVEMMGECEIPITEQGMLDPKILALALLSRALGNLKGVELCTRNNLAVEARVLARCCYENTFTIGGLHAEGAAFAQKMRKDNDAGRKSRLRFAQDNPTIFGSLTPEVQKSVSEQLDKFATEGKTSFLMPKQVSGLSPFKETYLIYSQFSGDAAHPTIMALARHWGPADATTAYFDAAPEPQENELDETLHLACMAVLGIMVVVNEMHGYTKAGKKLPELNHRLQTLQNEKWGEETINEGLTIRTEPTSEDL